MIYEVDVEGFGVILKEADTVADARTWANRAFPRKNRSVKEYTTKATATLSFGGGVDSSTIAAMDLNRPLAAQILGISLDELNDKLPAFDEVVFADTGDESEATMRNVARFKAALEKAGKTFHVVRKAGGPDRSVSAWCLRLGTVPLMPGGSHLCSTKFKGETIAKALGDRTYLIGIEANETRRCFKAPKGTTQNLYPLIELEITREMCQDLLPKLGFDTVEKSSCVVCPFMKEAELRHVWKNNPDGWVLAQRVEDNFEATSPVKHQAWIDAGAPLIEIKKKNGKTGHRAPVGMWRKDSWAHGARLFAQKIDGKQLSVQEWAAKFESEEGKPHRSSA